VALLCATDAALLREQRDADDAVVISHAATTAMGSFRHRRDGHIRLISALLRLKTRFFGGFDWLRFVARDASVPPMTPSA
jgi:hypothetical protein